MRVIVTTDPGPDAPGSAGSSTEYPSAHAAIVGLAAGLTDKAINGLIMHGLRGVQKERRGIRAPVEPVGSKAIPEGSRLS